MNDLEILEKDEYSVSVNNSTFLNFYEFLKEDPSINFMKYIERICFEKSKRKRSEVLKEDIPRLKWMLLLKVIPIEFFNMSLHECLHRIRLLLDKKRENYYFSFNKHQLDITKMTSMDPSKFHPLSQNADNPWNEQHRNGELLDEIWKDITRTFSDRQLFSMTTTRQLLQRVLFTWTRENSEFGYKQGMNELVAILFLINNSQKTQIFSSDLFQDTSRDSVQECDFESIFSQETLEADTYIMFKSMMDVFGMKYMFQSTCNENKLANEKKIPQIDHSFKLPIIHRCKNIYKMLETIDNELYVHLYKEHEIEPQLIFLRWIRLLFSREFSDLNTSIIIWEYLFCDALQNGNFDKNNSYLEFKYTEEQPERNCEAVCKFVESLMPIVNFTAISILILQRDLILNSDYNHTLKFIVNQSNISIDPILIIQKAKFHCYGISDTYDQLKLNNLYFKEANNTSKKVSQIHTRNNFFEHRDIHYSEIKNNSISNVREHFKTPKINEALLEVTRNLHISAKNINDLELLKNNVVSSCKELLRIRKLLQDKNI